jgi:LPXTG-motif cell wall-anchored protein
VVTTVPASGGGVAPSLVNATNQEVLTAPAGTGVLIVDGQPVTVQIIQAGEDLRRSIGGARTAEQVTAIREVGAAMLAQLRAILGEDATLPVSIRNVPTGAVVIGLVTDPVTGEAIEVPVEDVAFISGGGIALMVGGADGAGDPANIAFDGVLEFGQGGYVSILASGLAPGADGEVVVMSTPLLLDTFEVGADGAVAAQTQIPSTLAAGDHTVVVTVGDQAASLGFRVLPAGTLPSTGQESTPMPWAILVLATGAFAALTVARRRPI